jgi:DNA-binding SARP family transcriptional activator
VRLGETLLTFPTRKTLALLIYLALEGGSQPREHLATLLWPESNPERSYASLRNTPWSSANRPKPNRDQVQTLYLSVTTTLALNPDAEVDLDLHTVERAYALARTDRSSRVPP